jgi:hypothetical protein
MPAAEASRRRGLALIRTLVDGVEIVSSSAGTVVTPRQAFALARQRRQAGVPSAVA